MQEKETNLKESNSIISVIKNKHENSTLLGLNILFVALTTLFGIIFIYFDNNVIFSLLVSLSFILFLVILFLSIRKIINKAPRTISIISLVLFGAFLLILALQTNYYANSYDTINMVGGQIQDNNYGMNPYYYNMGNLFTNLGTILDLAVFGFVIWIIYLLFNLVNQKNRRDNEGNMFIQNVMESIEGWNDRSEKTDNSLEVESYIFINKKHTNLTSTCSKCGTSITSTDKYCPKCGTIVQDQNFIL